VKRAESIRRDAESLIEEQVESLLGLLRLASVSEVTRLERKVDQLSRRLRELEKGEKRPRAAA
jgi:polyhydroxyalkanoate synthesis regulator phasin